MGLSDKQIAAILTWTMMTTFWFFLLGIPGFSNLVQTNSTSIVLVVYPSGIHSTSHVYKHLIGNFMKHIPIYIYIYLYIYIYPYKYPIQCISIWQRPDDSDFSERWLGRSCRSGQVGGLRGELGELGELAGIGCRRSRAVMGHLMVINRDLMVI